MTSTLSHLPASPSTAGLGLAGPSGLFGPSGIVSPSGLHSGTCPPGSESQDMYERGGGQVPGQSRAQRKRGAGVQERPRPQGGYERGGVQGHSLPPAEEYGGGGVQGHSRPPGEYERGGVQELLHGLPLWLQAEGALESPGRRGRSGVQGMGSEEQGSLHEGTVNEQLGARGGRANRHLRAPQHQQQQQGRQQGLMEAEQARRVRRAQEERELSSALPPPRRSRPSSRVFVPVDTQGSPRRTRTTLGASPGAGLGAGAGPATDSGLASVIVPGVRLGLGGGAEQSSEGSRAGRGQSGERGGSGVVSQGQSPVGHSAGRRGSSHSLTPPAPRDGGRDTEADYILLYQCYICGRSFNKPQALGGHMHSHSRRGEHRFTQGGVCSKLCLWCSVLYNLQWTFRSTRQCITILYSILLQCDGLTCTKLP